MKYDFWYSEKQKHCLDYIFPPVDKPDTFIDGKEYTECFKHGKGHTHNWDDGIFIGTFDFNNISFKRRQTAPLTV